MDNGDDIHTLSASLVNAARVRGIYVDDPDHSLSMLLRDHESSSIYHCIATARNNATQVGTVELMRAISQIILMLDEANAPPSTPQEAHTLTNHILDGMRQVYEAIETSWFHQEALSEEEVYRRFVQQ